MKTLRAQYCGRVSYEEGLKLQKETWMRREAEEIPDTLLLLEHESVFTMGRRDTSDALLMPESQLAAPVFRTDRGGEVTYHGPGQLIGYLHAKLNQLPKNTLESDGTPLPPNMMGYTKGIGVKEFIYRLEESMILCLQEEFGLAPWRDLEHRGVWLGPKPHNEVSHNAGGDTDLAGNARARKIAALGIAVKQGVSVHGFAINLSTDLDYFDQIVPCGISDRDVTSLLKEFEKRTDQFPLKPYFEHKRSDLLFDFSQLLLPYIQTCFGYTNLHTNA